MSQGTTKKALNGNTTVNVALTVEQKQKLQAMAEADQRKLSDFVRILIDAEYKRRQQENGVVAA